MFSLSLTGHFTFRSHLFYTNKYCRYNTFNPNKWRGINKFPWTNRSLSVQYKLTRRCPMKYSVPCLNNLNEKTRFYNTFYIYINYLSSFLLVNKFKSAKTYGDICIPKVVLIEHDWTLHQGEDSWSVWTETTTKTECTTCGSAGLSVASGLVSCGTSQFRAVSTLYTFQHHLTCTVYFCIISRCISYLSKPMEAGKIFFK